MTVIAFSQRDPRWRDMTLGTGERTIGQAGCLITSVAALLATWGQDTDPARLNEYLVAHHGYEAGERFVFSAVDGLGCRCTEYITCPLKPAPVDRLREALAAGAGVVAQVDAPPGDKVQQHWVWLCELGARSGHIMDPWQMPGRELVGLNTYLAAGWSPARGIFAAAIYSRTGDSRRLRPVVTAHQDAVCMRTW
jgi:hypothetical protein